MYKMYIPVPALRPLHYDGRSRRLKYALSCTLLSSAAFGAPCQPLADVQLRLNELASGWNLRLSTEAGFAPPRSVTVCRLDRRRPYADYRQQRVFVRGLNSVDDEITLAHEYLHLAFSQHPRGRDEVFIEKLARTLVESP